MSAASIWETVTNRIASQPSAGNERLVALFGKKVADDAPEVEHHRRTILLTVRCQWEGTCGQC